jgi:hypothetical protein
LNETKLNYVGRHFPAINRQFAFCLDGVYILKSQMSETVRFVYLGIVQMMSK